MMRTKLLVKYSERVMVVVMCLSLSVSLSLLSLPLAQATEKSEDLGVLAAEHHQEPTRAGPQDGVPSQFHPTQQLLPSSQLVLQPTRAVKDKDFPAVEAEVTSSDVLQIYKPEREGSRENLNDANDSSSLILESLGDQGRIGFENTKTENMVQSQSSSLEVSKSLTDFGSEINQHKHSDSDTLSEPIKQNRAETVSDRNLKIEEKPRNSTEDNSTVLDGWIFQESQIQNKSVKYNINSDESEEDYKPYGNPPILLDFDNENKKEKVFFDLSSEESEKLQTEIAEKVHTTATNPSFTLFPLEENSQISSSETTSTSGKNATTVTSTTEATKSSQFKESSMLNMINNVVNTSSAEESQYNEYSTDHNSRDGVNDFNVVENKYMNQQNHGRKVLNEDIMKKTGKPDDEYELNIDSYFYDYYDEEEDDYIGGEVLTTVSSKAARLSVDQSEDTAEKEIEMTKDGVVDIDEQKENEEPGSDGNRDSGEFNNEHVFSYDADDDDWYYDPDGKDSADLTKTSSITTVGSRDTFSYVKSGDANASLSESKMEEGGGKLEGATGGGKEELPKKKVLQAPKGTIILYTAVIVVLIACIVFFSIWKKPFQDGRPVHQPTIGRGAEEGKRLLDHPFV